MTTELESQLAASVSYVREQKRQKQMTTVTAIERVGAETVVVHRDVSGPLEFTPQQCAMIRDTYANGASEKEFQVLMEVAKVRRLNPLLRQVHFVKRWDNQKGRDVWSVQVSVDGLRAIAERTGKYDGQDEPEYERDEKGLIIACRVKVYRKDWSRPSVGVAYWSEYVQTKKDGSPTKFWADMPHVMIAKCAEAIAMRKAFPEDLGGIYTDEEMQQADNGRSDNGTAGAFSPHAGPGELTDGGDAGLFRDLCGRFSTIEADIEACDNWQHVAALRTLLGTRAQQSDLTRTMQQKAEAGDISPTQRAELGKTWMRCNRKLEKLEATIKPPPVEASFVDEPETDAFSPERQPGEDDE